MIGVSGDDRHRPIELFEYQYTDELVRNGQRAEGERRGRRGRGSPRSSPSAPPMMKLAGAVPAVAGRGDLRAKASLPRPRPRSSKRDQQAGLQLGENGRSLLALALVGRGGPCFRRFR